MKIAIIGTGNVGTSLAGGWRTAGHEIVFDVRDPAGKKAELVSPGGVASTKDAAAAPRWSSSPCPGPSSAR